MNVSELRLWVDLLSRGCQTGSWAGCAGSPVARCYLVQTLNVRTLSVGSLPPDPSGSKKPHILPFPGDINLS